MNCPKCHQEMEALQRDITYSFRKHNKSYDRTIYRCVYDDLWMIIEFPQDRNYSIQQPLTLQDHSSIVSTGESAFLGEP